VVEESAVVNVWQQSEVARREGRTSAAKSLQRVVFAQQGRRAQAVLHRPWRLGAARRPMAEVRSWLETMAREVYRHMFIHVTQHAMLKQRRGHAAATMVLRKKP